MKSQLLLLLGIALLFSCKNETQKTDNQPISSKNYRIAYNVLVDEKTEDYDVFVMNQSGAKVENITKNEDVAWTYLGGKDKIFFVSDRDTCHRCYFLYEMKSDGSEVRKISDLRLRDSWFGSRKNGTELIVNPHPSVDSAFYIIDLKGEVLKIIETGLAMSSSPCFSPNGKEIAFIGAHKKSKRDTDFDDEIYVMQDDGKELRKVTAYPPNDTTAQWFDYKAGPPRWHPNGNFISYQSFQNGKYSLYGAFPDGSKNWKLTENIHNEGWHDWSSDGHRLAVEVFDDKQEQFHIALMDWNTGEFRVLTDTVFKYQQAPVFVEIE